MNTTSQADKKLTAYTIELALQGSPGPCTQRYACAAVKNGSIIASAWAGKAGSECPIEQMLNELKGDLSGACVYLSQELDTKEADQPPEYAKTLVKADVLRVVVGSEAFNPKIAGKAIEYLRDKGVEVVAGVLEKEVARLNKGLQKRYRDNMPWVCGFRCIGLDQNDQLIDTENIVLQATLERIRSNYDATVVVLPTLQQHVLKAPPPDYISLTTTDRKMIIVDNGGKIEDIEKHLNTKNQKTYIYSSKKDSLLKSLPFHHNTELHHLPLNDLTPDWQYLVKDLGVRGFNEIIFEINLEYQKTLFENNLLDELCIFVSPHMASSEKKFSSLTCETISDNWIKISGTF